MKWVKIQRTSVKLIEIDSRTFEAVVSRVSQGQLDVFGETSQSGSKKSSITTHLLVSSVFYRCANQLLEM